MRFATMAFLFIAGMQFGAISQVCAAGKHQKPEVWMAVLPADALLDTDADWSFVRQHVDGVKFWTQQVDYEAKDWPFQGGIDTPDALRRLIDVLNKNHVPIVVEKACWPQNVSTPVMDRIGGKSGPFDDTFAQRAIDNELDRIARIEKLGGKVRYIDLDGAIHHMLQPLSGGPGFPTIERCAQELTTYMLGIQKVYPDIEFFSLTNFPNWGYRGKKQLHRTGNGMGRLLHGSGDGGSYCQESKSTAQRNNCR